MPVIITWLATWCSLVDSSLFSTAERCNFSTFFFFLARARPRGREISYSTFLSRRLAVVSPKPFYVPPHSLPRLRETLSPRKLHRLQRLHLVHDGFLRGGHGRRRLSGSGIRSRGRGGGGFRGGSGRLGSGCGSLRRRGGVLLRRRLQNVFCPSLRVCDDKNSKRKE